jgi:tetratricopeptide (TPR) repeat protein
VRQGPSLPGAYYDWGASLLVRGDADGAMQKFEAAHQRGPHFADPLKAWGDALEHQGKSKAALAKYDEALKYAPNWTQLKEAREFAARQRS